MLTPNIGYKESLGKGISGPRIVVLCFWSHLSMSHDWNPFLFTRYSFSVHWQCVQRHLILFFSCWTGKYNEVIGYNANMHGCDITAYFLVLFYKGNRKWIPYVYTV